MAIVKRANVILTVKDSEVGYMVDLGYDVIDEEGNILIKTRPESLTELKAAYDEHIKEIASLKAEIESLKASAVEKTTKKTKKAE